jgi:hypothetical protein
MTEQWPNPASQPDASQPDVLSVGTEKRRGRGFAIGTACLAGGLALGVVGIAAATGTPRTSAHNQLAPAAQAQSAKPTPSASPGVPSPDRGVRPFRGEGPGFEGRGHGGHGGFNGIGGGGVLHGEFVTPKPGGGYQTVQVQRGTATAVSSTAITVKSADGFSRTYAVDTSTLVNAGRDGITSIAVNDAVELQALGAGDKATVADVIDETKLLANRDRFAPKRETPSADASKSTA